MSAASTDDVVEILRGTDLPDTEPAARQEQPTPGTGVRTDGPPPDGQAVLWGSPVDRSAVIDLRESHVDPRPQEPSLFEGFPIPVGSEIPVGSAAVDGRSVPGGSAVPSGSAVPGASSRHEPSAADGPLTAAASAGSVAPRILLLGEVLVENAHGKCESTRIGRLAETAAFVLLNPGARPSELQGALWPGRRANPQTCRQMISRARTWLGRTDAGESYLQTFAATEGRLRLRDEVGSDWADFQHLAAIGLADPDDTEHLTAALALVRGRPFGAVASRELPWADIHINEMISLISDVAHALALRHEAEGRRFAARDAALRGLMTESECEMLEEIVTRSAL
jgi:hypothetical protein